MISLNKLLNYYTEKDGIKYFEGDRFTWDKIPWIKNPKMIYKIEWIGVTQVLYLAETEALPNRWSVSKEKFETEILMWKVKV